MKTALKLGGIAGIVILISTYGTYFAYGDFSKITVDQLNSMETFGYLRYIIVLLAVYWGIKTVVKTAVALTFGALFMAGLQVVLVIAVIVGLMEYGYVQFWNPDFFDQYAKLAIQQLQNSGMTDAMIARAEEQMNALAWMRTPIITGLMYFIETFVVGVVGVLLAAFFFRSKTKKAQA